MRINSVSRINFESLKLKTLYFNDLHSSLEYLNAFDSVCDSFKRETKNDFGLILSGGDVFLDQADSNQRVAEVMSNNLDAAAVGNHDIGGGELLSELIKKYGMLSKWLAINFNYSKETNLKKNIKSSLIIQRDNEKIGLIGVAPFDFRTQTYLNPLNDFIYVDDLKTTLKKIKEEVNYLEKQGVDKIILLAHTGEKSQIDEDYYAEFANIGGIDVIIGGHDHREVDKWLTSSRGEPVKVVSVGQSDNNFFEGKLDIFGRLELFFDDFGVLVKEKCFNKFEQTQSYLSDKDVLNKGPIIHTLLSSVMCRTPLTVENKVANIVADSNLWYARNYLDDEKVQFALVNPAAVRGNFKNKDVLESDIQSIVPFASELAKVRLTKEQILKTLNWGVESIKFKKISPGIMQVSGLSYSIDKNGKVYNVNIVDEEGNIKFALDNLADDDEITCVTDEFLLSGAEGLCWLKRDLNDFGVEKLNISRKDVLIKYLSENKNIWDYKNKRIYFDC